MTSPHLSIFQVIKVLFHWKKNWSLNTVFIWRPHNTSKFSNYNSLHYAQRLMAVSMVLKQ